MENLSAEYLKKTLERAQRFVTRSRELILGHYQQKGGFEIKDDDSPVTAADIEAEELLRELIGKEFPSHGIIGEEFGEWNPDAEFQWILDPVDGTQNFATGIPTFGTLLGVQYCGEPVVGIIDHPALSLNYAAAKGLGATCNGKRISIEDTRSSFRIVSASTRGNFLRTKQEFIFDNLIAAFPDLRVYYDCFPHGQCAQGRIAATIEFNVKIWDLVPALVVVTEAGGCATMIQRVERLDGPTLYSAVLGRTEIVAEVVRIIGLNPL